MNPLLLWGLGVVGLLVMTGVAYALGIRAGYAFGEVSDTEDETMEARIVETEHGLVWKGPTDPRTRNAASTLKTNSTGPTISTTWTEFSYGGTPDRPGPEDVPRGFRGEDLSDKEVEEWLRDHGLKDYE